MAGGSRDDDKTRQVAAAKRRFRDRAPERRARIAKVLTPGGLASADTPERIAKRIDRLSRFATGVTLPNRPAQASGAPADEVCAEALERSPALASQAGSDRTATPLADAGAVLEKIINSADFVAIRYFDGGVRAARAVGRVVIRDQAGRTDGYGTGSLVSPRLLLTNHHVLPDPETAQTSAVEFNYQDGPDGQPLQARLVPLDPDAFFLADEELDFALVAMGDDESSLAEFGFNPLIEAEGKAIIGEFMTIIQHPGGEKKQVSLRENRIVDMLDSFLHYEADTEPGSSGSPVFNDQWEVVGLHHASVPAPDEAELGGFMNEGIRMSAILRFVRAQHFSPEDQALVDRLGTSPALSSRSPPSLGAPAEAAAAPGPAPGRDPQASAVATPSPRPSGGAAMSTGETPDASEVVMPLELVLRIPSAESARTVAREPEPGRTQLSTRQTARQPAEDEAVVIDPDYTHRAGYDSEFLGSGALSVPLPALSAELMSDVSLMLDPIDDHPWVLRYHHYSVIQNKARRLAFLTAVNIDGLLHRREDDALRRQADRWFFDPRIPAAEQTGENVYADNDLDRGHLVRRLDPAWGETVAIAKLANDDTFHFTNCTPQHARFNQNKGSWAGLEDYVLYNSDNADFKASVFTGPVFSENDQEYRGVQLPEQFWKVAVMVKEGGELSATAYLLSQDVLLGDLEEFTFGEFATYQVPVSRIEELTGISFGDLSEADPLLRLESALRPRRIDSPAGLTV